MIKKLYVYSIGTIIHCISLQAIPLLQAPITPPAQATQISRPTVTPIQAKKIPLPVTSSAALPIVPPIPVPVNQQTQKQLQFALKPQPIPPHLPQDYKKIAPTNNTESVAFVALVATGIAYILNNNNSTDTQRVKPRQHIPPKKDTPSPVHSVKTGFAHLIDQQYARLEEIATEYEETLRTNPFYQSERYRTRIQKRIDAIKQWKANPNKKIDSSRLSHTFTDYSRATSSAYTTITADPIQRALHKEIKRITDELAHFQTIDPTISGYLFNHATLLMEISRSYTGSNIIVQAMNAADVCWEIIEAAGAIGPDVIFSKNIEAVWHQFFVYSHAKIPECTIDWDQFELEKSRWYTMKKQCAKLVEGCGTLIYKAFTNTEYDEVTIGQPLVRIATAFDNFLLNEVFIKIDILSHSLRKNVTKLARHCKKNIVDKLEKDKKIFTDFIQSLYNQIPSPTKLLTNIALNSLAIYLIAGLFSNKENPIEFSTAAMMGTLLTLIHSSSMAGTIASTILTMLKTNPIQALIIGAALVTPVISPLIEEYRATNQKSVGATYSTNEHTLFLF